LNQENGAKILPCPYFSSFFVPDFCQLHPDLPGLKHIKDNARENLNVLCIFGTVLCVFAFFQNLPRFSKPAAFGLKCVLHSFVCSCPGRAITKGETILSCSAHNHLSDPGTVEGKKVQIAVLQKAADNPKLKTSQLVEEFAGKTLDPSFRTRTVTVRSLEKQIQRAKAKALRKPNAPRTFDDLEEIPDEFKVKFQSGL
jgi:hypothetical protein